MDLLQTFNCIPNDFLGARFTACGFKWTALKYIYSSSENCDQCISLNKTYRDRKEIILGVSQVSLVGPNLFNGFWNDFLIFIKQSSSVHNFADDNTSFANY